MFFPYETVVVMSSLHFLEFLGLHDGWLTLPPGVVSIRAAGSKLTPVCTVTRPL